MVKIIMCFYSACKVAFQTGEGVSDFVEQLRGIVQGCPLSPTLFILVIDLLIQYVKFKDFKEVKVGGIVLALLAFADDVKLFARTKKELQRLFEALRVFSEWANLTIKIEKCGQLTIPKLGQHGSRAAPVGSELEIDGTRVPVVGKLGYPYLGCFEAERLSAVPNIGHIEKKLETAVKQMETEDGSAGGLREYATFLEQHIVAVSTYIQFQTQALNGAWTERMDNWIIGKLRMKALQVTNFSASTIGTLVTDIHRVKKRWGGTGIARFNRARESTAVAAAVGLLEQGERLECVVERFNLEHYAKTYGRTPESPHFKDEHGKGLEYRPGKGIQRHEFWAKAMRVATKVGLTLDFDGNSFTRYGTRVKLKRKKAGKRLAVDYEDRCWDNLKKNAAQGAYFRAIPTSARESLRLFPRFDLPDKLVVFALVARCDNLPVNVVLVRKQMRFSEACECAGCDGSRETITHVLSGCGARSGMYTVRHNAVADAFVGAIEASLRADGWEVARECFPDPVWSATGPEINGTQTHRKPDIVLYHVGLRIVLVIEVKCPSELCVGGMQKVLTDAAPRNGGGNLRDDDEALIQGQAYFRSARRARRNGWQAWARALVVGALGAVDESEVRELVKPLKLEKAQIKKAVAAVQVAALEHSRRIWRARCTELGRLGT
ncbi:hypothetical protein CYMTET_17678 [Cymbomonas tetramitiformis]|uniref:Reverse transcriptase domain-containing protein n=1 Tax=Cymbomonas tetramitiformis TaxID=36881 RepID=A0AAE0G9X0_9CHLO|nr:hypothetical protein CYMTET_17678 [Cymbomonas tetramitiformis]